MAGGSSKGGEVATANPANLAQDQANQVSPSDTTNVSASDVSGEVAKELAKLLAFIVEKSENHTKKLEEIQKTTNATERKIADIASQIAESGGSPVFFRGCMREAKGKPPGFQLQSLITEAEDR